MAFSFDDRSTQGWDRSPPGRQYTIFGVDFLRYPLLWLILAPIWLIVKVVTRIEQRRARRRL